jgi:hypothetical protein
MVLVIITFGISPVKWELYPGSECKADESVKSFLFTLKNPVKAEKKRRAIRCDCGSCPGFGDCDLVVIGRKLAVVGVGMETRCANESFGQVFMNQWKFTVKEIEVFEITD